jgi:hypothetical protein
MGGVLAPLWIMGRRVHPAIFALLVLCAILYNVVYRPVAQAIFGAEPEEGED